MELRYRATDGRPSPYAPPRPQSSSSSASFFQEQAIRVGYSGPNIGNTAEYFRHPNPEHEREAEKARIRAEIIAAEWRRVLEEEVKRELMAEREMALRRGSGDGYSMISGFEPRFGYGGRRKLIGGGLETEPPFQRVAEPRITEFKPEVGGKEKIIFLAKPEGNSSGAKRKVSTPPAAPSSGSKKKHEEKFFCAICQVSTTCERGLNEHLLGKKHKSKETGLVQKAGNKLNKGKTKKCNKKLNKGKTKTQASRANRIPLCRQRFVAQSSP